MKRGLLLFMTLLFIVPFVSAVPTFNLFSGEVFCGSTAQTGYTLFAVVDNGTDTFNETGTVSATGEYVLIVGAVNGYNVSFYVNDAFVEGVAYNESSWIRDKNITLGAGHSLCSSGTVCGDGNCEGSETCSSCPADCGTCGGPTGGPSGTTSDDECGDDDVNQNDEECDGSDLDDETCLTLGFEGGDLACKSDCTFDVSSCTGTSSYCDDGNCSGSEWDLTDPIVDVSGNEGEVVVSVGGDYDLVIDGSTLPFSIYDISDESATIDIDGRTYVIGFEDTTEIDAGDYSVLVSYLSTQDGKAKLVFMNAGVRAVSAFPGVEIVYYVFGIIILAILAFFLVRWLKGRSSKKGSGSFKSKGISLKPSVKGKKPASGKKKKFLPELK